jgi:hypothetical protein
MRSSSLSEEGANLDLPRMLQVSVLLFFLCYVGGIGVRQPYIQTMYMASRV